MSHKQRGLGAQIQAGVLDDTVPRSSLRQKCRCQPLLDRAADLLTAEPGIHGWMVTASVGQESAPVCDG